MSYTSQNNTILCSKYGRHYKKTIQRIRLNRTIILRIDENMIINLEAQELEHTIIEVKEKDSMTKDGTQTTKIRVAINQEMANAFVI